MQVINNHVANLAFKIGTGTQYLGPGRKKKLNLKSTYRILFL